MASLLKVAVWMFVLAYMLALALLLIGTFGLFGQPRDPLSGIFLLPLGLPWARLVELFPHVLWPWLTAMVPLINLAILWLLYRIASDRTA